MPQDQTVTAADLVGEPAPQGGMSAIGNLFTRGPGAEQRRHGLCCFMGHTQAAGIFWPCGEEQGCAPACGQGTHESLHASCSYAIRSVVLWVQCQAASRPCLASQ